MFGHQNDQANNLTADNQSSDLTSISPMDASVEPAATTAPDLPEPSTNLGQMLPTPTLPKSTNTNIDESVVGDTLASSVLTAPPIPPTPSTPPALPSTKGSGDLLDIKQNALQQLSPLVNHLDQTPEEKFRTLMMMIQAADDQSLIKQAYEAANSITNEKVKAQALLDVVNEINYFTHPHEP